ncbi:MAG: diguanylate cyclase [Candidatus Obscuribacterales bacterium]|nr:diguanylate cyclase [Candidatus Obscuribacterales bacterium]
MKLSSFVPRAICVFILAQIPIWVLVDILAPSASNFAYEIIAEKASSQLKAEKTRNNKHCADIAQKFDLSWLQLTDKNKKVVAGNRPQAITEAPPSSQSTKQIDFNGNRYIELCRPFDDKGATICMGFSCPGILESIFQKGVLSAQIPSASLALAALFNAAAFLGAYLIFLGLPLKKATDSLQRGEDIPDKTASYVSSEIQALSDGVQKRFQAISEEHSRSMSAARSDLSGVFAREVEDRFIDELVKQTVNQTSAAAVCKLVLDGMSREFDTVLKAGFGFALDEKGRIHVIDSFALTEEQLKQIASIGNGRFLNTVRKISGLVWLAKDELGDKIMAQTSSELGCEYCLIDPIEYNGEARAFIAYFVIKKENVSAQKLERIIKKLSEQIDPLWHVISNYETAYWLSRHDHLTGARNLMSLSETLQNLPARANYEEGKSETIFLVFEGDSFRIMTNSYGPRTIDQLIQELAQTLLSGLEQSVRFKKASSRIRFSDYLYRVGGCRFLLILEDSNVKKAEELAESVSEFILSRKNWAHGLPNWSVSCGISRMKASAAPEETLEEAMIALEYVRSRKSTALVLPTEKVPQEFMSRAQSRNQSNNSPFDPVLILQKMEAMGKAGILTVSSFQGRVFWAYLENGKASKARLGELCGDAAILEFISTFTEGSYRLQDLSTLDAQTASEVKAMGGSYRVSMPMLELIDFSLQIRDAAADAKVHLKTPDMIVHHTKDKQAGQLEALFHKSGKQVNALYLDVANAFWDQCTGRLSLDEILQKLNDCPQALLWTVADFLMQNKMIKFSRLRVSAHTGDGEKEAAAQAKGAAGVSQAAQNPPTTELGVVCSNCNKSDPLNQRFCVHCGAELNKVASK